MSQMLRKSGPCSLKLFSAGLPPLFLLLELLFGFLQGGLNLDKNASLTILTAIWMISWWILEVMPLGITALLPLFIFPMLGIASVKSVAPNFSNSVIYLFLGGFIIACALEKTQLSRRMALYILKYTATSDKGIIIGFIIATAFLSMWISNTATTVMMLPIALSVLQVLDLPEEKTKRNFSIALFLSIAYAANIGGIMTPIGTPPNVVLMGYLDELYGRQIDFSVWMLMVAPTAALILLIMFSLLKIIFPFNFPIKKDFKETLSQYLIDLGPLRAKQKITLIIFSLVCILWMTKSLLNSLVAVNFLNDTSIAIAGGASLFLFSILNEGDIKKLPWNIVLLFGGGMALAATLKNVGLIELATQMLANFNFSSPWLLIFVTATCVLFLTEVMSNVALCVVALPLLLKLGETQGMDPLFIAIPATLCASFAFSMPISTPPNAIVFGTGRIKMKHMLKAGLLLNVISIIVVMSLGWSLMNFFLS